MSRARATRGVRLLVAVVLLVAIGGLFAALSAQLISAHRADGQRLARERAAVPYVDAVARLTLDLVETRSGAVRGQTEAPANLRVSMTAVTDQQANFGSALTAQRWTDLRAAIDEVRQRPTGADAADRHTDLITLATDLLGAVLTESRLDAEPAPASHSLVVAVRELLDLVAATGRAADTSALAVAAGRDDATELRLDLALALNDAATAYADLSGVLTTAVATGAWPPLTSAVSEQLNLLHDALRPSVGPAALRPPTSADTPTLDSVARQVRDLARATLPALLTELDRQLGSREEAATSRLTLAVATAAAGFVLGLVILWWSAAPPAPATERGDEPLASGPDVASVSVNLPAVDARELLALEELVHVGRGVRARPSGGADDAE